MGGFIGGFLASLGWTYFLIKWDKPRVQEVVKKAFEKSKAFTVSKRRRPKFHDDDSEYRKENGVIGL